MKSLLDFGEPIEIPIELKSLMDFKDPIEKSAMNCIAGAAAAAAAPSVRAILKNIRAATYTPTGWPPVRHSRGSPHSGSV